MYTICFILVFVTLSLASIFGFIAYGNSEQNLLSLQSSGFSPWLTSPDETILKHFVRGRSLALAIPPDPEGASGLAVLGVLLSGAIVLLIVLSPKLRDLSKRTGQFSFFLAYASAGLLIGSVTVLFPGAPADFTMDVTNNRLCSKMAKDICIPFSEVTGVVFTYPKNDTDRPWINAMEASGQTFRLMDTEPMDRAIKIKDYLTLFIKSHGQSF
jgi:hypothetical protein